MKLKRYNDYILESILIASENLKGLLSKIDDPIANEISNLIDTDIKTKYNAIDSTDENSTLSFISDNQAITKLKAGVNSIDLFSPSNNKTTIGRVVKSILKDNGIDSSDKDVAKFVDRFKAEYDKSKMKKMDVEPIRIIKGEDIRYWYYDENYCEDTISNNRGTLGKSCMRYATAQAYLDIYTKNPDKVSLVIYVDDDNKLRSRALLWETTTGKYLDRIYYTSSSEVSVVTDWVKENVVSDFKSYDGRDRGYPEVKLSEQTYNYYPYMDTLCYYYKTTFTLYSDSPDVDDKENLLELQDTDGGANSMNMVWCEYESEEYPSEDTVYSEYSSVSMYKENAVFSKYKDSYLWGEDTVYSEPLDDYLLFDDAQRVYLDEDGNRENYYLEDSNDIGKDSTTGDYYLKKLLVELDNGEYSLEKNTIKIYDVLDTDKYKNIYNTNVNKSPEIDSKIFGFELSDDGKLVTKKEYYESVYENVIYIKLINLVNSIKIDSDIKSIKIDEINEANNYMKRSVSFYKYNNDISLIGVDQLISDNIDWYIQKVESYFTTIFNSGMDNDKLTHKMDELELTPKFKRLCKKICKDPKLISISEDKIRKIVETKFVGVDSKITDYMIENISFFLKKVRYIFGQISFSFSEGDRKLFIYYISNMNMFKNN